MTIVADVKERGFGAVRDWAVELDGVEPVRAAPAGDVPRDLERGQQPRDEAQQLAGVFRSVVDARGARYLMLNAPEASLEAICALVPGSRAPSVLPLAEPGMVAVHALVRAADVWQLLPSLEAAGGSSILIVPVERMAA